MSKDDIPVMLTLLLLNSTSETSEIIYTYLGPS